MRVIEATARRLAAAGLILLLAFAAATLMDGLARSLLRQPIDAVRDLGSVVVALAASACIPYALLRRANITIRFWGSLGFVRLERVLDVAASVLVLAVLAALAQQIFVHGRQTLQNGEASWMIHVPLAPFWFAVDAFLWFGTLCQAALLIQLVRGRIPAAPSHEPL